MEKQKTGFWKAHPLLKAITVLVAFFSMFVFFGFFYMMKTSVIFGITYSFFLFYYMFGGIYILGGLYGIWLERRCHFKRSSYYWVLPILFLVLTLNIFVSGCFNWIMNGYVSWEQLCKVLQLANGQILSVAVGYTLSIVITYIKPEKKQNL